VVLVILAGMREKELDFEFRPTYNTIAVTFYQVLNHALDFLYSTAIDYLNDFALDLGHNLEECAQIAYNKISKQ